MGGRQLCVCWWWKETLIITSTSHVVFQIESRRHWCFSSNMRCGTMNQAVGVGASSKSINPTTMAIAGSVVWHWLFSCAGDRPETKDVQVGGWWRPQTWGATTSQVRQGDHVWTGRFCICATEAAMYRYHRTTYGGGWELKWQQRRRRQVYFGERRLSRRQCWNSVCICMCVCSSEAPWLVGVGVGEAGPILFAEK